MAGGVGSLDSVASQAHQIAERDIRLDGDFVVRGNPAPELHDAEAGQGVEAHGLQMVLQVGLHNGGATDQPDRQVEV